jgi:hypothetical protein
MRLGGDYQICFGMVVQIESDRERVEKVFHENQSSFTLLLVFEVAVPATRRFHPRALCATLSCGSPYKATPHRADADLDLGVYELFLCRAVVIPERD